MKSRTCDGKCCAVFPLAKDLPERLEAGVVDGEFIKDMLVPLTVRQAHARARKFGYELPAYWFKANGHKSHSSDLYTCRHWDEETRLCTVYESRPRMCRDYPYARVCDHDDGSGSGCGYMASKKTQARYREK